MNPEEMQLIHVTEASLFTEGQQHLPVTKSEGFDKLHRVNAGTDNKLKRGC